jgi:YidC/Oxa1 family membrane protein insertase
VFELFIVQPIFNLLVFIHAIVPGGNFGVSIVVFTVVIRLLMLPLVRKQLHQTRAMRELQPDIKRIKKETKGNRQQESLMLMELYKEKGINPFSSMGTLIIQLVVLLGLFSGLRRVIDDPTQIVEFAYSWIQGLPLLQEIAQNPALFDNTFLGIVDLSRAAVGPLGLYIPALLLVTGSAITQYFQSSQLMPDDKDARGLRQILREASEGKQADSSETNAAVARGMKYFIPVMIFVFTIGLPSALSLYWFTSGLIAYYQQARILKQDEVEMESIAAQVNGTEAKAEVIQKGKSSTQDKSANKKPAQKRKKKSSKSKSTKRRK